MFRILGLEDAVRRGAAESPTAYVDTYGITIPRLGKALDAVGLEGRKVRTGLGAKRTTLTILRKAAATRHNPSLKRFMDILAKRQDADGELSALVPAPTFRRFAMPGFEGTVETRQKTYALALGTRIYSIAQDGEILATMVVREREPNAWEALGFASRVRPEAEIAALE